MLSKRKSVIIIIFPLIIITGYYFINYAKDPFTPGFGIYPTLNHTERAKVTIIKLALQRALVDGEIIDGPYPSQDLPLVVSTRNIDPYWVLPPEGWDVQVMTLDEIKNEYSGVSFQGRLRKVWLQFNKIEFRTGGFAKVRMGLMHDEFSVNKWGIAYWGLEIWFEYKHEEGWVIQRSQVLVY